MLRVCDGQRWRCLLRSGNCGSVFPRVLVTSTATVSATFLLAVQQRESPGTALLPRPPGLLWHCWATGGFVWSFVCSSSVSSPALGSVRTWAGAWALHIGSCMDLMWPSLCLSATLAHFRLPAALEPLTWRSRISFVTKTLSSDINLYCHSKTSLCFYGFSKGIFDILRYSAITNNDRNSLIWDAYLTLQLLPYLSFLA